MSSSFSCSNIYFLQRNYKGEEKRIIGVIENFQIKKDSISIKLKTKLEKLEVYMYLKDSKKIEEISNTYQLGDIVELTGKMELPTNNTNFNSFNYKKYLFNKHEFYIFKAKTIKILETSNNLFYMIKNHINKKINLTKSTRGYLKAFVLGDNKEIDKNIYEAYQSIGISHLFAISGMHVGLLTSILLFILSKIKTNTILKYIIVFIFLYFYIFLTGFSPSVLRVSIFFILSSLNKLLKLYVKPVNILILTISIILISDPFIIYNIGFLYSAIISFYLIVFSDLINKRKNYFTKLFVTSSIAFVASIPITLYNFYSLNYLSILYNLIFVPLISIIIFPLSLLTFILSPLEPLLNILIDILEHLGTFCNSLNTNVIFKKLPLIVYFIYYILITLALFGLRNNKKKYIVILLIVLLIHTNYNNLIKETYVIAFDVGQGDSILIHSKSKNVMIDTGESKKENIQIPVIKSLGIKKIEILILSHGDADHAGEAINLVNIFKVEKVIFNCGPYNDLEKELIKVLDKKKIKYYSCINELNIDKNKLYFLQTKLYDNENDNSNVIYTEIDGYKFMFMGDAGIEKEKDILEKYNISNIDVLKVGHHGSKTSSSEEFINEMNQKYSVISVGKNNRYGHPNKEVLDNLENSKIYRTDQDGSIMFKTKNNELQIETCSP